MQTLIDINVLYHLLPITLLGALSAWLLLTARKKFSADEDTLVSEINKVLPQTQCAQCGYPGCRPYAEAIANGAAINRCPPGGAETIIVLAELLGREPIGLDPECGEEPSQHVVTIDEAACIGCTLCIAACPVDAIIGAQRMMHTVIASHCTGCDLCIEPCPVDCISIEPIIELHTKPTHPEHDQPCINCGLCVTVCPRELQPQLLYRNRFDLEKSGELNLDACIECRLCDTQCPSDIPLTENFKATKALSLIAAESRQVAQVTEMRYQKRNERRSEESRKVVARPNRKDRAQLLAALKEP
ncbi:MAG: electron transport complex protein RnfB [Candidatus Azotimanducaceae bacterium]